MVRQGIGATIGALIIQLQVVAPRRRVRPGKPLAHASFFGPKALWPQVYHPCLGSYHEPEVENPPAYMARVLLALGVRGV